MLWYKAWREVRWIFLLALPIVIQRGFDAMERYREYGMATYYVDEAPSAIPGVSENYVLPTALELFLRNHYLGEGISLLLLSMGLLLGIAGLGPERSRGTAVFTLSLPVTRRRHLLTRFGLAAAVLLAVALASTITIVVLATGVPAGEEYRLSRAFSMALCIWSAAMMPLGLSFLIANIIGEPIKSIAAAGVAIFGLGTVPQLLMRNLSTAALAAPFDLFRLFTVADLTLLGTMPWTRLLGALLTSGMFVSLAVAWVERRDY